MQGGVGTSLCPWQVTVLPGQRINLFLYTFGVLDQNEDDSEKKYPVSRNCREIGVVEEGAESSSLELCPFRHGRHLVYTSQTNQLKIQLSHSKYLEDFLPFFIQYQGRFMKNIAIRFLSFY